MPPRTPHRVVCHERSLAVSLTWKALDARDAILALLDAAGPVRPRPGPKPPADRASPGGYARLVRAALRRAGAAPTRHRALQRARAVGLVAWDVVSGRADPIPPLGADRLWTQVPACPVDTGRGSAALLIAGGGELRLPPAARPLAAWLPAMPSLAVAGAAPEAVRVLLEHGVLGPRDLPLRLVPTDPGALDGWRFA